MFEIYGSIGRFPSEFKDIGYMRGDPHENQVSRLVAQLKNLGVDIRHHNHQVIVESVRKVSVEATGIVHEKRE